MTYETGSASSSSDLVNKLAAFCVTNGWTQNLLGNDGSGRRLHMNKGTTYINLRSFVAENLANVNNIANYFTSFSGVAIYGSDGFDNTKAWQFQPGYLAYGAVATNNSKVALLNQLNVAIPTYHFFSYPDNDDIFCVIEFQSGRYQMLGFGQIAKYNTSIPGGAWFSGSTYDANFNQPNSGLPFGGASPGTYLSTTAAEMIPFRGASLGITSYINSSSYVRINANGHNGWAASGGAGNPATANWPPVTMMGQGYYDQTVIGSTVSPYTWQTQLLPVVGYIVATANTNVKAFGEIKYLRRMDISNYTPSEEFALGSDTWKVFPLFEKSGFTGTEGYAIKKVA